MMLPLFDMGRRDSWLRERYQLMQSTSHLVPTYGENLAREDLEHRYSAFCIQWICIAWCMLVGTEEL